MAIFNSGYCFLLPCGLIWERIGPRWSSFVTMVAAVLCCVAMYILAHYPDYSGSGGFWLVLILFFLIGV